MRTMPGKCASPPFLGMLVPGAHQSSCACRKVAKATSKRAVRKDILVGFDAVAQLVAALEERLGHCALFCVDALGGDVIGVKWRPDAWLPAPFRVAAAHTMMPCHTAHGPPRFVTDAVAVMQDILHLGRGIVADVFLIAPEPSRSVV